MDKIKQALIHLTVYSTDACNFRCSHCAVGDEYPANHMSIENLITLLEKAHNPFLSTIALTGGEPTIHPQFDELVSTIKDFFESKNVIIPSPELDPETDSKRKKIRNKVRNSISEQEKEQLKDGEWRNLFNKRYTEKSVAEKFPNIVYMDLRTNGWFMLKDQETFIKEANKLMKKGFNHIGISNDIPHQEYAKRKNLNLNYDLIKGWHRVPCSEEVKKGRQRFGKNADKIGVSGNGWYVIPVGAARDLPWSELIRMGRDPDRQEKNIKKELAKEYNDWENTEMHSHSCYCSIKYFFKNHKLAHTYQEENAFQQWGAIVSPDLSVHECNFKIIPPIGNLKEADFNEIYNKAVNNPHIRIIAEQGPQGLARKLTDWSEKEIKERFIERTPCVLCEDIYQYIKT